MRSITSTEDLVRVLAAAAALAAASLFLGRWLDLPIIAPGVGWATGDEPTVEIAQSADAPRTGPSRGRAEQHAVLWPPASRTARPRAASGTRPAGPVSAAEATEVRVHTSPPSVPRPAVPPRAPAPGAPPRHDPPPPPRPEPSPTSGTPPGPPEPPSPPPPTPVPQPPVLEPPPGLPPLPELTPLPPPPLPPAPTVAPAPLPPLPGAPG
jgi:hypothetical protein